MEGSDIVTAAEQRSAEQRCDEHDAVGLDVGLSTRRRGAALEDAILQAAYAELSEVGYLGLSVEAVAARARTGKASIYRRWPTKQLLVLDALCAGLPDAQQCGLAPVDLGDRSTVEALHDIAKAISQVLDSPAGDAMRAVKCEAATDPELARAIDERFQEPRRQAIIALLQRGVDRGEVRPEAASQLVADVIPAVLTHRMIVQRERVTERDLTELIDQIIIPLIEAR
jgi:AcrR family transcriptional regulator